MQRSILLSFALGLCLASDHVRPAAPPTGVRVPLESQLSVLRWLGGGYELGGRGEGRYVARLDLHGANGVDWKKIGYSHLAAFDRLEGLVLDQREVTDADVAQVARVRSLRSLDLSNNRDVTDESARLLAAMPRLERLNLDWTGIGPEGAAHLGGLRSLRWLKCDGIGDAALAALARCRRLEYLEAEYGELSEKGARAFGSMRQLRELQLHSRVKLPANAQPHLGLLTGLRILNINGIPLTDAGFEAVTRLPALEELTFGVHSRAALAKVGNMKSLRVVRTGGVGDGFLEALSRCKAIREVKVQNSDVTDAGVAHLVRCPALRELHLGVGNEALTDGCVPSLIRMKALRKVWLGGITRAGYDRLRKARPELEVMSEFQDEEAAPELR